MSNVKVKFNKIDIKKAALDAAKDAIHELDIDVECPNCGKTFKAHEGLNVCPHCKKTIDINYTNSFFVSYL